MNPILRKTLIHLGNGASALAIAGALVHFYESSNKYILTPYKDPVGIWTVCDGITGKDVIPGKKYTTKECDTLNEKHMAIAEQAVKRQIKTYDLLSNWAKGALISYTYNVGESNLSASTLRKYFNRGQFDEGCDELTKWVYANKQKLPGLVARRGDENELCKYWGQGDERDPFSVPQSSVAPSSISWSLGATRLG